jgi:hypothetical protein
MHTECAPDGVFPSLLDGVSHAENLSAGIMLFYLLIVSRYPARGDGRALLWSTNLQRTLISPAESFAISITRACYLFKRIGM